MTPRLILGPLLRHVGASDATVWVETEAPGEVEVLVGGSPHRSRTFSVEGHHYALVVITDLEPGSSHEYSVKLDGDEVWPEPGYEFPAPVIRTIAPDDKLTLVFGSCRVSLPHEPPYTNKRGKFARGVGGGYERDVLYALALRMQDQPREEWPDALLLLGDQVYADEVSLGTLEFIRSRRDTNKPPGEEVADFEEYTRLYWDSWKDPAIRWLLSTVPSAMIFDDHDVHDDWNTSETWVRQMRRKSWWEERIVGAFMSYWVYQHLGNLSPQDLEEDELFGRVQEVEDATRVLREFAYRAHRTSGGTRWSFHRDFGRVRLIMMDSRGGRVLEEGRRSMVDDEEWAWIEDRANGDFDHILLGTSLPVLLGPGMHHLQAWNEAVCRGAWGEGMKGWGERIRRSQDLDQWASFHDSFVALTDLIRRSATRENNDPPASIAILSGDIHHGYLARASFRSDGVQSPVYQAVCSPLRNALPDRKSSLQDVAWTKPAAYAGRLLSRLAGIEREQMSWHLTHNEPWFENHVATLVFDGRQAHITFERAIQEDSDEPGLQEIFTHPLA